MKKERLLSLLAGVALLLGFFLPWISMFGMSMSGITLVQANFQSGISLGGIILLLLPLSGIGLLIYSFLPAENKIIRLISNLIVTAILLYTIISIVSESNGKFELGQLLKVMGIGFYLTTAGIILSIVDLIRTFTSKPTNN